MSLRLRVMMGLMLVDRAIGNTELRLAIGRPDMPPCTLTWHLNELTDLGAVTSNRQWRYNRWQLTPYGQDLLVELLGGVDGKLQHWSEARRMATPAIEAVRHAEAHAPRSVFDVHRQIWQHRRHRALEGALVASENETLGCRPMALLANPRPSISLP